MKIRESVLADAGTRRFATSPTSENCIHSYVIMFSVAQFAFTLSAPVLMQKSIRNRANETASKKQKSGRAISAKNG